MDTSDLLKICPITVYPAAKEGPVIVLALFSQHCDIVQSNRKQGGVTFLNLKQISLLPRYQVKQSRSLLDSTVALKVVPSRREVYELILLLETHPESRFSF